MAGSRGQFSSRIGFILAAAGSAVGLGNIWGFPTQAASNGGAAFLFVYLILAFTLAYPALMAELIIGRHAHANAATALRQISPSAIWSKLGRRWYRRHGCGEFNSELLCDRGRLDDWFFRGGIA